MHAEILATSGAGPPLVYVPGVDGSGELLLGTAARLERHFRLTRLRYAGDGSGDYVTLARSVAACLQAGPGAEGQQRVLVLAESFGVGLALQLALDHPERVAAMALVNGFAHYSKRLELRLTRLLFRITPGSWIRLARGSFARQGLLYPRRDAAAMQALRALDAAWFGPSYLERLAWIAGLDLRARLGEVRCPVALFAADEDRIVRSVAAAREMQAALPDAELTLLRRAGHVVLPLVEEPWEERLLALARRVGFVGGV